MYSTANFNLLNSFKGIIDDEQKDTIVKTKNAGIFIRHNKKALN